MPRLLIGNYPRAILHIDGDAFFASCEVAKDPSLRGKPVITGKERGIASALTYEAKAHGVKRGMTIPEIKRICPDAVILPSDYETYSLYSARMFNIVRRYAAKVEEYSIDECFAELTGMRRSLRMGYEEIAEKIKHELDSELGITFSVGLAPTKVLAKVASKWKKPSGLTFIPGRKIDDFLREWPVDKIWGVGPATTAYFLGQGVKSSLDYAEKQEWWVREHLTKPHYEIWKELNGECVYEVGEGGKESYKSISKTKTFTPASRDREFVFSQLSKNIENACIKARRHGVAFKKVFFFLKTQDFKFRGIELKLSRASNIPTEIIETVKKYFDAVFMRGILYRSTGVVLSDFKDGSILQLDLFGEAGRTIEISKIFESVDEISEKYGKHAVFLGSSFSAMRKPAHTGARGDGNSRTRELFRGETKRRHLALPMLGIAE